MSVMRPHVRPSSVQSQDYTFKVPDWPGIIEQQGESLNGQLEQYEIFDYPEGTRMNSTARISRCTGWRARAVMRKRPRGRVIRRSCGRGCEAATGHPQKMLNRNGQVVQSILQETSQRRYGSEGRNYAGNQLEVIPADRRASTAAKQTEGDGLSYCHPGLRERKSSV